MQVIWNWFCILYYFWVFRGGFSFLSWQRATKFMAEEPQVTFTTQHVKNDLEHVNTFRSAGQAWGHTFGDPNGGSRSNCSKWEFMESWSGPRWWVNDYVFWKNKNPKNSFVEVCMVIWSRLDQWFSSFLITSHWQWAKIVKVHHQFFNYL